MRLSEVISALDAIAPPGAALKWDNVGLLVGDPAQEIARALFTIDFTADVAAESQQERCQLVVAYHPPIFEPLKRVVAGGRAFEAVRAGVAIYSPHTALDVANGGTNDVLADIVGMKDRSPLTASEAKDLEYKLVFFVPRDNAEKVCAAIFEAGAGNIGAYSSCSFRASGTGTFFGGEAANPTVGAKGRLEHVEELRVETVLPIARVTAVLAALRTAHPYEEPAFDLVRLAAPPTGSGLGRIGAVDPVERRVLVDRLKSALGVAHVLVAGPLTGETTRVAVCAGSCGDLYREAARRGAQVFITGEMRHHDALAASEAGITVVATLHSVSERVALPAYAARLKERCPSLDIRVSRADRDPFQLA